MNIQKISPLRFEILRPVSNLIPTDNRITPNTLPSTRILTDLRSWTWRRWSNFVKRMILASGNPQRKSSHTLELYVLEDRATPGSALDLLFGFDKPDFVTPSTTAFQSPKSISESGRRSGIDSLESDTPSGNLVNVSRPAPRQGVEEASGSKTSPGLDDLPIPFSIQGAFPLTGLQISGGGNVPSDSMDLANNHPLVAGNPFGANAADFGNSNSTFNGPSAGSPGAAYTATSPVPGPLQEEDFTSDPFLLRSGITARMDVAFSITNAPAPVTLSGTDTVNTTGVDFDGVGYTTSTTYTFAHTIASATLEDGSWSYTESYRYTFDAITTPETSAGATVHQWGTSGYSINANGAEQQSSFVLIADLTDHETGFYDHKILVRPSIPLTASTRGP